MALWLRRGTSTGVKTVVSLVTVTVFVVALAASPSNDSEPASAPAPSDSTPADDATVASTTAVPHLRGLSKSRAERRLRAAGLELGRVTRRPTSARSGTVLAQGVVGGKKVEVGTRIALVVAVPFPKAPSVVGQPAGTAVAELRGAGYTVKKIYRTRTSGRDGAVITQSPRGGTPTRKGSMVTLTVLQVVAPPPPPPPQQPKNCTPGYSPCLPPAYDYDCAGGSGDGPKYTGLVYVTGYDPYDLDADGDGVACE